MEREGETLSDSLALCLCQPTSLSVFFFLSVSVSNFLWLVCLLVSISPTHPILITHPPIQDYFH